jgi:hypothetical protein
MVNADWFHLRNVNVCHFEIVKDTGLNTLSRGQLQWHDHSPEFHENLPAGSNITSGDTHADMDKQTTWRIFINFTFLFKESRQKNLLTGCSGQHYATVLTDVSKIKINYYDIVTCWVSLVT